MEGKPTSYSRYSNRWKQVKSRLTEGKSFAAMLSLGRPHLPSPATANFADGTGFKFPLPVGGKFIFDHLQTTFSWNCCGSQISQLLKKMRGLMLVFPPIIRLKLDTKSLAYLNTLPRRSGTIQLQLTDSKCLDKRHFCDNSIKAKKELVINVRHYLAIRWTEARTGASIIKSAAYVIAVHLAVQGLPREISHIL